MSVVDVECDEKFSRDAEQSAERHTSVETNRFFISYVIAWNQYLFCLYTNATRHIAAMPWMANRIRAAAAAVMAKNSDMIH